MALRISDFTGGIDPISADYPFYDIKNDPSGTRVDKAMLDDTIQVFQKLMHEAGITPNSLPDNATNGYQYFQALQDQANAYAAAVVINIIGPSYATGKVYVLSGLQTAGNDGVIFYNGKVYFCVGRPGPSCGGGLVDAVYLSPTTTTGMLQTAVVACGTSGTGISDYAGLIFLMLQDIQYTGGVNGTSYKFTSDQNVNFSVGATTGVNHITLDSTDAIPGKEVILSMGTASGASFAFTTTGTVNASPVAFTSTGGAVVIRIKFLNTLSNLFLAEIIKCY